MKPSERAWKTMMTGGEDTLEIHSRYVDLPTVIEILDEQHQQILALEKRVEELEKKEIDLKNLSLWGNHYQK